MPSDTVREMYRDDLSLRQEFVDKVEAWLNYRELDQSLSEAREKVIREFEEEFQPQIELRGKLANSLEELHLKFRDYVNETTIRRDRRKYMNGLFTATLRRRPKVVDEKALIDWGQQIPEALGLPEDKILLKELLDYVRLNRPDLLVVDPKKAAELAIDVDFQMHLSEARRIPANVVVLEHYVTLPSRDTFDKVMRMVEIEEKVDANS